MVQMNEDALEELEVVMLDTKKRVNISDSFIRNSKFAACKVAMGWSQLVTIFVFITSVTITTQEQLAGRSLNFQSGVECDLSVNPRKHIFCHFSGSIAIDHMDPCLCTHLVLTDWVVNRQTLKLHNDIFTNLSFVRDLKEHHQRLKVLLLVNGRTQSQLLAQIGSSEQETTTLATNVAQFLTENRIDGLSIDWEPEDETSKDKFTNIAKALRMALDNAVSSKQKHLIVVSVAPSASHIRRNYDFEALSKLTDFFYLAAYNLTSRGSVSHHSRLLEDDGLNGDSLLDLMLSLNVSAKQILLGVPTFGVYYRIPTNNSFVDESFPSRAKPTVRVAGYQQICNSVKRGGWTTEREEDKTGPYSYTNNTWVGYDDPESVRIKSKYVVLRNLAGVGFWRIDNDDFNDTCGQGRFPLLRAARDIFDEFTGEDKTRVMRSLVADIELEASASDLVPVSSPFRITGVVDKSGAIHRLDNPQQSEFVCTRPGYYRHPADCTHFYRCVKWDQFSDDFTVFQYECPSGLVFDEKWEVCNWPSSTAPCEASSEIHPVPRNKFICPGDGYFTDPENCRWFYKCSDLYGDGTYTAYEFRCPFDLAFDEGQIICNWRWLVPSCGQSGSLQPLPSATHTSGPISRPEIASRPGHAVNGNPTRPVNLHYTPSYPPPSGPLFPPIYGLPTHSGHDRNQRPTPRWPPTTHMPSPSTPSLPPQEDKYPTGPSRPHPDHNSGTDGPYPDGNAGPDGPYPDGNAGPDGPYPDGNAGLDGPYPSRPSGPGGSSMSQRPLRPPFTPAGTRGPHVLRPSTDSRPRQPKGPDDGFNIGPPTGSSHPQTTSVSGPPPPPHSNRRPNAIRAPLGYIPGHVVGNTHCHTELNVAGRGEISGDIELRPPHGIRVPLRPGHFIPEHPPLQLEYEDVGHQEGRLHPEFPTFPNGATASSSSAAGGSSSSSSASSASQGSSFSSASSSARGATGGRNPHSIPRSPKFEMIGNRQPSASHLNNRGRSSSSSSSAAGDGSSSSSSAAAAGSSSSSSSANSGLSGSSSSSSSADGSSSSSSSSGSSGSFRGTSSFTSNGNQVTGNHRSEAGKMVLSTSINTEEDDSGPLRISVVTHATILDDDQDIKYSGALTTMKSLISHITNIVFGNGDSRANVQTRPHGQNGLISSGSSRPPTGPQPPPGGSTISYFHHSSEETNREHAHQHSREETDSLAFHDFENAENSDQFNPSTPSNFVTPPTGRLVHASENQGEHGNILHTKLSPPKHLVNDKEHGFEHSITNDKRNNDVGKNKIPPKWAAILQNSTSLVGPVSCQRAGLFRHPDDCTLFYECFWDKWLEKFTLHYFECPVKLAYDDSINGCNWPFWGPPCEK